jgi:hypothetical protein
VTVPTTDSGVATSPPKVKSWPFKSRVPSTVTAEPNAPPTFVVKVDPSATVPVPIVR